MKSLKDMLKIEKPLVIPGVYDALGAKISQKVGFDAIFQTGYGTSATLFGMPDIGFVGATETVDNARRICNAVPMPVIVDADTGYGNALSVWKLVKELEAAGAGGIFLEDQKWPKRCGHMQGKEVITQEEYTEKLSAAIDARTNKDFVIVARTDARATEGLDEAIERGKQNKKTGADAIFIEAPESLEEMKRIGNEINAPLVANMIEGGATPLNSAEALDELGFKIILYPLSVLYANTFATMSILKDLKDAGSTLNYKQGLVDFDQFNELVELQKFRKIEKGFEKSKSE